MPTPSLRTLFFSALALLAVSACSPAKMLNATVPSGSYTLHAAIPYGGNPRQKLDIYVPKKPSPKAQVVMWFYGGSWNSGRRDIYKFVGEAMASSGYYVVIPDYRLYPEVRFPDFLLDNAAAVRWTQDNIGKYGANPNNLFLSGHSAGAYNAVMLALHPRFLPGAGVAPASVRGVIGFAGPYDFLPITDPEIKQVFSTVAPPLSQPITFVRPGAPPMLLATGITDDTVLPRNTYNMAEKLRSMGNIAEVREYKDVEHYGIVLSFAGVFRHRSPALEDMRRFIEANTP